MTTVCNEVVAGSRGDYYGAKLEIPSAHIGLSSSGAPWRGSRRWKQQVLQYRNSVIIIVLGRDSGAGEIRLDPTTGEPQLHYTLAPADQDSMVRSLMGHH